MVGQESLLKEARRIVVKVGSALVTNDGRGLDVRAIERWAGQIAALRAMGREVLLVSSGAIAEGVLRIGWETRPTRVCERSGCRRGGTDGACAGLWKNISAVTASRPLRCSLPTPIWRTESSI